MKEFDVLGRAIRPLSRRSRFRLERLRADPLAYALVARIARLRRVSLRDVMQGTRGTGNAAQTRQLAMYLVHVLLSRPQDVVGELFDRDRTTVSHACIQMELLREENSSIGMEVARVEAEGWGQLAGAKLELSNVA